MRKAIILLLVLLTVSPTLTLIPRVYSQPGNVIILNYSWRVDSWGVFTVTGEVQNVGSMTIDTVILKGTVYTKDGNAKAYSEEATCWAKYLLPQQKAPFIMDFPPRNSLTGDLSWLSLGVDHIDFVVELAETTSLYQYQNITIEDSRTTIEEGFYYVNGTVQNTGDHAAKNIRLVGTFYNASNIAIATGASSILDPISLAPSQTASFWLAAIDLNQTIVPSSFRISSYSLQVQTEEPIFSGTGSLPANYSKPVDSSPAQPPSSDSDNLLSSKTVYVIVALLITIGSASVILFARKRR